MDLVNNCTLLIANWLCAICLTGTCELNPRVEAPKPPPSAQSSYTITVSTATPATIPEQALTIELVSVKDSRCAVEVKCVWAGNAEVELRVSKAGATAGSVIVGALVPSSTGNSTPTYGGYRFNLVSLEPLNSMSKPVAQALYRATLSVTARDQ